MSVLVDGKEDTAERFHGHEQVIDKYAHPAAVMACEQVYEYYAVESPQGVVA